MTPGRGRRFACLFPAPVPSRNLATSLLRKRRSLVFVRLISLPPWRTRGAGGEDEGVVVQVRRLKTDPHFEGDAVDAPYGVHEETCPITHLSRWIPFSGRLGDEPLFCRIDRHGNLKP